MCRDFYKYWGTSKDTLETFLIQHDLEKSDSFTPTCFSFCCKEEDHDYRTNYNYEYNSPFPPLGKVEPKYKS